MFVADDLYLDNDSKAQSEPTRNDASKAVGVADIAKQAEELHLGVKFTGFGL